MLTTTKRGRQLLYLASTFSRQAELREYRKRFEWMGHKVVSRWLDVPNQDFVPIDKATTQAALSEATDDMVDIVACDIMVLFTLPGGRGQGHHVEFGAAWALEKEIWIVGPRENVFHALVPDARHMEDFMALYRYWTHGGLDR